MLRPLSSRRIDDGMHPLHGPFPRRAADQLLVLGEEIVRAKEIRGWPSLLNLVACEHRIAGDLDGVEHLVAQ